MRLVFIYLVCTQFLNASPIHNYIVEGLDLDGCYLLNNQFIGTTRNCNDTTWDVAPNLLFNDKRTFELNM